MGAANIGSGVKEHLAGGIKRFNRCGANATAWCQARHHHGCRPPRMRGVHIRNQYLRAGAIKSLPGIETFQQRSVAWYFPVNACNGEA